MQSTEAIIFINFDSDETAPQFVFHGALEITDAPRREGPDGTASKGSPVRRSLEVRVLVLIDKNIEYDADADVNTAATASEQMDE